MRKIIKCSSMTNKAREWLRSEETDKLVKGCTPQERRLIGKMSNSTDPLFYLDAMSDALDILGVDVSESFDKFIQQGLELL